MKLHLKTIEQSIKNGEKQKFFEKLDKIYSLIPYGVCQGCTKCCMESVNTFYTEFVNIYRSLKNDENLFNELKPRIFKYYFLELVEKMNCPFLNSEGKCQIYEVRPLSCRLFGYWDQDEYEQNYKRVLRENKSNYKYFRNTYNLVIPKKVIDYKIDYCKAFQMDRKIYRNERQSMVDSIFTMESNFFMKGLITEDFLGTGLVSWFVYTHYDMEEAGKLRVKVMREYLENGESETLDKILETL